MPTQKNKCEIDNNVKDKIKLLSSKYNYNSPGYYSYPTVVDFNELNKTDANIPSLISSSPDKNLSIYIHIPFCQSLCYYCGCNKEITQDRGKAIIYIDNIIKEIQMYKDLVEGRTVESIHFGGGSPNFLTEFLIVRLITSLYQNFNIKKSAKLSIEVDPRTTTPEQIILLSKCGFERISFGVQDFHENVQNVINRVQSREQILKLIKTSNKYGFESVNIDLIYGLPLQTVSSFQENVELAVALDISRLTITKYSHFPKYFPSQRKLDKYPFPTEIERLLMFYNAKNLLKSYGFTLVGLDHFVKERDPLFGAEIENKLVRNFMGYDVAHSSDILGLGVSAISNFNGSYYQNAKNKSDYYNYIDKDAFPISKLCTTSTDNQRIWSIIHGLLCYKFIDLRSVSQGENYDDIYKIELEILNEFEIDGLVKINDGIINVTELGTLFLRNICSVFDRRIDDEKYFERFSTGI